MNEPKPTRRPKRRTVTRQQLRTNALDTLGRRPSQIVRTAAEALEIRDEWRRWGKDHDAPVGPKGDESPSRLIGDPIGLQVTHFVEETQGFVSWRIGNIEDAAFFANLEEKLPYEFFGPWPGLCEAEIEEMGREPEEGPREDDDRTMPGLRRE